MGRDTINHRVIRQALLIRKVEQKFLELFSKGKLNGTVHTCVGQEFSAVAFAGQLKKQDFVFSNHRCHGHYLAFTGDVRGLLAELLGKKTGTSGGVGSSQHLCKENFFSNGIQGGIVPVAAGFALANKLKKNNSVGIVFIGDGTLGEGVLYETMNIVSKWKIPLMIVCEDNQYAQSTPRSLTIAGDIKKRAEAFGIKTFHGDTWHPEDLIESARGAIDFVRNSCEPAFFLVDTYRLNAHSKGDDDRDPKEVNSYLERDFLTLFKRDSKEYFEAYEQAIDLEIESHLSEVLLEEDLTIDEYYPREHYSDKKNWVELKTIDKRQVDLINEFFKESMEVNTEMVFIGEDVLSPYGGAFKVAKDLSILHPERVFSTPISEGAIMGLSNGMALNGKRPFAEIMFGDFVTLAFDQIINHASKFFHMFNHQVKCPVVLRTPMGGRRGYGPTHSQTLDKFLIGIDNVTTVALNTLVNPKIVFAGVLDQQHPVIVIENKVDYGKRIFSSRSVNFRYLLSDEKFPVVRVSPLISNPDVTIVCYGGMADILSAMLEEIFKETDQKPELIVLTKISPLDVSEIIRSVEITRSLVVVEEGSATGGIGSEVVASVTELVRHPLVVKRIAALPVPIPSVKSLEQVVLPNKARIIEGIKEVFNLQA